MFFGRVIDQNDRAVSDENIRYTLGAPFGMEGSRYCFSKTDSNGLFLIEGKKAHSLNFYTLKKEGYVCRDVLGFYGYDHTRASKKWTDTSPSKPFVFNLWKIGGGYARLMSGSTTPYSVDSESVEYSLSGLFISRLYLLGYGDQIKATAF